MGNKMGDHITGARLVVARAGSAARDRGEAQTTISPRALKCLGRPPLLKGEKLEDFNVLLHELAQDFNVTRLSEWLIVGEIARLKWISLRLRRAEAGLFEQTLSNFPKLRDQQVALGTSLRNNIDTMERSSRMSMEMDRRCDVLIRNLRRLQSECEPPNQRRQTIDLEAEEVTSAEE
jgi:hypothetical protein